MCVVRPPSPVTRRHKAKRDAIFKWFLQPFPRERIRLLSLVHQHHLSAAAMQASIPEWQLLPSHTEPAQSQEENPSGCCNKMKSRCDNDRSSVLTAGMASSASTKASCHVYESDWNATPPLEEEVGGIFSDDIRRSLRVHRLLGCWFEFSSFAAKPLVSSRIAKQCCRMYSANYRRWKCAGAEGVTFP